jgi:hypothetical protein
LKISLGRSFWKAKKNMLTISRSVDDNVATFLSIVVLIIIEIVNLVQAI